MILTDWDAVGQLTAALTDARSRLGVETKICHVYSWPQTWPDSACGFPGGLACRAFWEAQTAVLVLEAEPIGEKSVDAERQTVLVYHQGRFAYLVEGPSDTFWESFGQLPGVSGLAEEGVTEGLGYRVLAEPEKAFAFLARNLDDLAEDDTEISY